MGFGLGAAIGSSIGTNTRSVLITGDGSFGMCLNELATAVTYNIPVTIVIFNNQALGMVRQWQKVFFDGRYSNTTIDRKTDFVKLAQAFGAKGFKATDKESFEGMFGQWCAKWDGYLRERTTDPETGKSHYTHKRLRSAYLSVKRNLPLLFTWYDNIEMGIPNTTNLIDGHFSQLKRMLRNHNGMKRKRRDKLVIGFFEASRILPEGKGLPQ